MEVKQSSSSRRLTEMRARVRAVDDLHLQSFTIPAHEQKQGPEEVVLEMCAELHEAPSSKGCVNASTGSILPSGAHFSQGSLNLSSRRTAEQLSSVQAKAVLPLMSSSHSELSSFF